MLDPLQVITITSVNKGIITLSLGQAKLQPGDGITDVNAFSLEPLYNSVIEHGAGLSGDNRFAVCSCQPTQANLSNGLSIDLTNTATSLGSTGGQLAVYKGSLMGFVSADGFDYGFRYPLNQESATVSNSRMLIEIGSVQDFDGILNEPAFDTATLFNYNNTVYFGEKILGLNPDTETAAYGYVGSPFFSNQGTDHTIAFEFTMPSPYSSLENSNIGPVIPGSGEYGNYIYGLPESGDKYVISLGEGLLREFTFDLSALNDLTINDIRPSPFGFVLFSETGNDYTPSNDYTFILLSKDGTEYYLLCIQPLDAFTAEALTAAGNPVLSFDFSGNAYLFFDELTKLSTGTLQQPANTLSLSSVAPQPLACYSMDRCAKMAMGIY